jgi:sec-independent protein translocase protein TatB
MFDISWTEFLLVGVVALIFIGPKELPAVMRTMGQWTRRIRSMAADFQGQFQEAMREAEMADLKKEVDDIAHGIKSYDPLKDVRADLETAGKDIQTSLDQQPLMTSTVADAAPEPITELPLAAAAAELHETDVVAAATGPVAPETFEKSEMEPAAIEPGVPSHETGTVAEAAVQVVPEVVAPEAVETAVEPDGTRRAG